MSFEGPNNKKETVTAPAESQEGSLEQFPTKEAIIEMLTSSLEGLPLTFHREINDEKGLVLLEMRREGEAPGEIIEYAYTRKGAHLIKSEDGVERWVKPLETSVDANTFYNGVIGNATNYARYDESTGTWKVLGDGYLDSSFYK